MYYPIQIPYILHQEFARYINYTETPAGSLADFVICFWEMQPYQRQPQTITNIIVADGCIDLVASFDKKIIGFSGMSHTDFNFTVSLPCRYIGARLMPGAFHQLTGLSARAAMDAFLPLKETNSGFDESLFFSLPFSQAKNYFIQYFHQLTVNQNAGSFTRLFNQLEEKPPETTAALYQKLHFSARQCQRLFDKHYGITPKMALSILRFQKCLEILTSVDTRPEDVLGITGYYDQPHFIRDFKKNIGITPMELVARYKD